MALTPQEITASQYFDEDLYVEAKARIMVMNGKSNSLEDAKAQFQSNWTGDMADHYLQYGAAENVNPSNSFDNSDYIQQVADAEGVTYQELKADWESQGIAPLEHFLEEGQAQGFTAPAVSEDERVGDDDDGGGGGGDDDDDPGVDGDFFTLTAETDDMTGTAGNDFFYAYIVQNSWAGGVSNSLSSADRLDGGAGTDTLHAEIVPEFFGVTGDNQIDIQPRTTSIENITFEAREINFSNVDNVAGDDGSVTVDAKHMTGINEIGSYYSDGDLVIENLTTLTDDGIARNTDSITITMDHTDNFNTDNDASDLEVYFDEDYLLAGEVVSGAALTLRLVNAVTNEADGNPVEQFNTIVFSVGGTDVTVDITAIAGDATLDWTTAYDEIVDAINDQLTADGFTTVTAELAPAEDAIFSIPVAGFQSGDPAGSYYPITITNSGPEELAGVTIDTAEDASDTDLNNSFQSVDPETADQDLSVNIELHKVGRDGEGGDLIIGGKDQNLDGDTDVDQTDGINVFDITVLGGEDKPSNLGVIRSTNGELETVNIDSAEPGEDADGEDTWADLTVTDQLGDGQELTEIDATDFEGDFSLAQNGAQQVVTASFGGGDDYMSWESVEADGVPSGKDYSISMGAGDDELDVNLDGDSVDAYGESFSVDMGSGDDELNVTMDGGVSQSTMADLHSNPGDYLEIETGAGDDVVNLDAYGNFNIETGAGSDFVQINSLATGNNGNALTGEWVFGPATSGLDTFGDRVLYKAQLTVSFAGFESTVDVETDRTGNFVADQMTINTAIIAAIDANHELTDLLEYDLGTDSQQLTIESVVGGRNDLAIALYQPEVIDSDTDDDDVDPGQVKVATGDLTALRQGLINTTADDSADLEEEADIIAAIDNGSIDQNGDGDGVTYAYITNDTVLDGANDTNAAPDQDIFDLAGVDLYQDYDAGTVQASTDSTTGINFSTIDVGDGSNDIVVMHSNHDESSNILKISESFGKVSVVNFHSEPTDAVASYTDVADHALDFTTYLTNQDDPSDVPTGNTQSVVPVAVTLNIVNGAEAFGDSGANPDATNNNAAIANGVNVLRFDENVDDPDDLQTFEDLTADILRNALNDADDDGSTDYGNLDQDLLTPDDFGGNDLQSTTQQHIVMVENDQNEGEYKVFHLTSSVDADGEVDDESEGGVHQFDSAVELGTLDFGASINFQLFGSEAYTELRADLIAAADGIVVDVNTPPVATNDLLAFTVAQGESVDIPVAVLLANDEDADGDALTIDEVAQLGTDDGTAVLAAGGSSITFTAAVDFEGTATFAYRVTDGQDFDTAVVTGTVTAGGVVEPGVDVQAITQADDNEDFDAATFRTDPENAVRFEFAEIDADNGFVPVFIQNFSAGDQLKTGVAIDEVSYIFDTPAATTLQMAFDWAALPDSYIVYLEGIDAGEITQISDALDAGDTVQDIVTLVGTLDGFSTDWLVA